MRILRWDDGTRFDDLNAYWGEPSYVLEPGDPGYRIPPPEPGALSSHKTHPRAMSINTTPTNRVVLLSLGHRIHAGQVTNAVSVGLMRHLAPAMDAALKKLEGDPAGDPGSAALKGSQLVYRDSVDATGASVSALGDLSDGTVKTWLDGYRSVMEGVHGKKANDGWVSAGFPAGSTAVPKKHELRHTLIGAARANLAGHVGYEASLPQGSGPNLAITAAQALTLWTQMQTAFTLITTREGEQAVTKASRDTDVDGLYEEVSMTIAELRDCLEDADARWELFGLNIPANPNAPEGVASLTVTAAGAGREHAEWPYAVRADYYRLFLKRTGVDTDFVNVADPRDLEYTLKGLTAGSTIEVYVVPMNDGGAGPASPTVTKVVGA